MGAAKGKETDSLQDLHTFGSPSIEGSLLSHPYVLNTATQQKGGAARRALGLDGLGSTQVSWVTG